MSGDSRLLTDVRDPIRDPDNKVYLSTVSIWESIVKYQLGKLPLPAPPETYLVEQRNYHRIASLDLNEKSVALANLLPLQRDPFDRMLICQALDHRMTIATVERTIRNYPVYVI